MKKYIFATLTVLAVLSGCKKEDNKGFDGDPMNFTASIMETKTTISDGSKLLWQENDEVSINGVIFKAVVDEADASKATLVKADAGAPDPVPEDGKYIAVYPASLALGGTLSLPTVQEYRSECELSGINPMYAEGEGTELLFRNVCGLFELNIQGTGTIASIAVKDSENALSGEFTVVGNTAVLADPAAKAGVTLDCGEDGVTLDGSTLFYIAIPAGEYGSLSINVISTNGFEQLFTLKAGVKAIIERNTIYPVSFMAEFGAPSPIDGEFSVGAGEKVKFAKGNLFWNGTKWALERTQYACGESWDPAHVSLFSWTDNNYGTGTAYTATESTTVDWGKAFCEGNGLASGTWRTLTSSEWNYMLNLRTVAEGQSRFTNTIASPVTIDGIECCGLFIYPDSYEGSTVDSSFTWESVAEAGIVYLPAAGCRYGETISGVGIHGYYWAQDSINSAIACNIAFNTSATQGYNAFGRQAGYSVRLVTE